ncbi:MAG: sulfonate transport system permease protein [Pseudonocardiales bacterium]|nr:sulfonate transport system permease protein [Pseudonocardiales bacterium]
MTSLTRLDPVAVPLAQDPSTDISAAPAVPRPGVVATTLGAAIEVERLDHGRRRRRWVPRPLSRLLGVALALGAWQLASSTGSLSPTVVGSPRAVWNAAIHLISDGELGSALASSLHRVLLGLLFGLAAGIGLALVSGLSRIGEDIVDAPVQMLRTVPFVGLVPLLIVWLGVGETPKVVLIALAACFPIYLNLSGGIRSVDPALVEAGRTLGLSRLGIVRHVVLPSALPQLLVGLRLSLGSAWLALVFAAQISATSGLGYLMSTAQELLQTDTIVVCLVVYALLGLTVDLVVRALERLLLSWRPRAVGV